MSLPDFLDGYPPVTHEQAVALLEAAQASVLTQAAAAA